MPKPTRGTSQGEETPRGLPDVPPPRFAQPGHDFTLQAVMEMQKTLGDLSAKVERLIGDVKSQGDKVDGLRHQASFIKGGIAVAVFFITGIVTVASFILSAKWDALLAAIKAMPK